MMTCAEYRVIGDPSVAPAVFQVYTPVDELIDAEVGSADDVPETRNHP